MKIREKREWNSGLDSFEHSPGASKATPAFWGKAAFTCFCKRSNSVLLHPTGSGFSPEQQDSMSEC